MRNMNGSSREHILENLKKYAGEPSASLHYGSSAAGHVASADLYVIFANALAGLQGRAYRAGNNEEALSRLDKVISEIQPRKAVVSDDPVTRSIGIVKFLSNRDIEVLSAANKIEKHKDACFTADIGITGADYALADTGTVAILHWNNNPRLYSIAPHAHIAIVPEYRLLPDMDSLIERLQADAVGLPAAISLITGPSSSADICMTPIIGMHGPGRLYVLITSQ
jgi:L-lactate dehydrogenase complex protein LldG